ncbi:MAG: hypothetical protein PHQ34_03900 [Methanothrix sp.]|nr:hypothetical protein [Methanothrix sp.]
MVHNTPARKEAKGLRQRASDLSMKIKALEGIEGTARLAGERQAEAARLQEQARELVELARLEDITVWEDSIIKQTKKGERKYGRWMAGWREGGKPRKVYLGSCRKLSHDEALQKAREAKRQAIQKLRHAKIEIGNQIGNGTPQVSVRQNRKTNERLGD